MNDIITIRAFRPQSDFASYRAYLEGHRAVLTDLGLMAVVKSRYDHEPPPDCVIVVAEHAELGIVGGIRIEIAGASTKLPMQQALGTLEPRIDEAIGRLSEEGLGEICGLWNSGLFAGRGVPLLLSEAAVSLVHKLGIRRLVCFVAHYTLRHALKVGFQLMDTLGDGGAFTYPIPRIKSFAMVIPDTLTLASAPGSRRQRIVSLRCRPQQERVEAPTGIPYAVRYRLHLDADPVSTAIYRHIAQHKAALRA